MIKIYLIHYCCDLYFILGIEPFYVRIHFDV